MKRTMSMLTAAVAGAGALIFVGAAGVSAATGPIVQQPFYADSGDKCPMGYTKGTFGWQIGALRGAVLVDVKGTVVDQPLPGNPAAGCADDARYTTATFTAYSKSVSVAKEIDSVDNGQLSFTTRMRSTTPIDRIVVQVCRHSRLSPPDYCGMPQEYKAPITQ